MIKPNEKITRALKNLESNTSWKEIVDWIRESWFTRAVEATHKTGEDTCKFQGRAVELEELYKYIKNIDLYVENAKREKKISESQD